MRLKSCVLCAALMVTPTVPLSGGYVAPAWAAEIQGDLVVQVQRADNDSPIANAKVRVIDREGLRVPVEIQTDAAGKADFRNLLLGDYYVEISHPDYAGDRALVKVTPDIANAYKTLLDPAGQEKVIKQHVDQQLVATGDPKGGATTERTHDFVKRQLGDNDSLQGILTTVPGLQRDANGQIHARGEHKSVSFSVDGVTLPVPFSNSSSHPIDPEFLEDLQVQTGSYDASQGGQLGVFMNAVTQGGYRKPFVSVDQKVGNLGQFQTIVKTGGSNDDGSFSYFIGAKKGLTDVAFEAPNPDHPSLNNHGDNTSLLLRLNGKTDDDDIGVNLSYQKSIFGIPQTPDNYAAGVRQEQQDTNLLFVGSWKRKLSENDDVQFGLAYLDGRQTISNNGIFTKYSTFDAGISSDLAEGGLPSDPEHPGNPYLPNTNLHIRQLQPSLTFTLRPDEKQRIQVGGSADFIDSNQFVDILDAGGGGLLPGGVSHFNTDIRRNAFIGGAFFSHTLPLNDQITLNYGLRLDTFNNGININTSQLSPLVNLVWAPTQDDAIRLSYNRVFQAPPLELDVSGQSFVLPQKISTYELSYERQLAKGLVGKVGLVRKDYTDQIDNGLLIANSQIPLYGPVNFAHAYYQGVELSLNTRNKTGWNGFFSGTYSVAKPTQVGIFQTDLDPYNDHDQRVQIAAGLSHTWDFGLTAATDIYYGSGYPLDAVGAYNSVGIAPFGLIGTRIPRFQQNLNINYFPTHKDGETPDGVEFGGGLQVVNLWDDRQGQNFYSAFSGTRFTLPRRVLGTFNIRF